MKWLAFTIALFCLSAHSESIYLCKAYSGGTFWVSTHCNQHSALIDSIVSVPGNLPFQQQANLAEQQRRPNGATTTVTTTVVTNEVASKQDECKALNAQVAHFDAMARQPQSGQMQDWLRGEKRKARDRQFEIKC
ncbi:MAG: hypothetical protein V4731_06400 [Pseudomonadota bacterium]